jgi:2-amino-4-hydroxy-6-hydroxymethyldihydropteridine diphosphokinase
MILIALGSNIDGPWGNPRQTVMKTIKTLDHWPIKTMKASTLIETAPYGNPNQPNFVNAIVQIRTALSPDSLIRRLHMIEKTAGRIRGRRWGPRTLDLDIIDYNGLIRTQHGHVQKKLVLPHPGIAQRSFVLEPILEIAPHWKHPLTRQSAKVMIQKL